MNLILELITKQDKNKKNLQTLFWLIHKKGSPKYETAFFLYFTF